MWVRVDLWSTRHRSFTTTLNWEEAGYGDFSNILGGRKKLDRTQDTGCKTQDSARHKTVQNTRQCKTQDSARHKTQDSARHKTVQDTTQCKTQHSARHNTVQDTRQCKTQDNA